MLRRVLPLLLAALMLFSVPCAAGTSDWAKEEVEAAIRIGIVPEHLQCDYQNIITREEFCEIAVAVWTRLTKGTLPAEEGVFADTDNPSVVGAKLLGIVNGVSETEFAPLSPVTRQEICVMLKNTLAVSKPQVAFSETRPNQFPDEAMIADWAMDAVQNMHLFAVMLGDQFGNINPLGNTTREQAILLAYRLIMTQAISTQEYIEQNFMPINSNTQSNMYGGAFIGFTQDRATFYVDSTGIRQLGKDAPIFEGKAEKLVVFKEALYFIGEDGGVYLLNRADNTVTKMVNDPTDSYAAVNGHIYYRNLNDGGKIYGLDVKTMVSEPYINISAELPVFSSEGVYYADGQYVYTFSDDGVSTPIFSGGNKNLCIKDKKLYFISNNGPLAKADLNGANFETIARVVADKYNFTRDCFIVLGTDGFVYKVDFDGKYTIKLDTDTYVGIVTYNDYVYAQKADGAIYKMTNNGTEKAKIN